MIAATTTATWNHEQDRQTETVEQLIRRAQQGLEARAVAWSPSKVSRAVRAFIRRAGSLERASADLDAYFLNYADPTGETAVRNIMAGTR